MDMEDIKSDLYALRQLYGLLKVGEDGLPNKTSQTLDNKARILLKSLLDSATERILKAHSQIISGQVDASLTCTSAQPQHLNDSANQQHLASLNAFKRSWEKQSDGIAKPANEVGVIEVPNLIFSATETENTRKRCRICQRPKIVKQFKPVGRAKFSHQGSKNSIKLSNGVSHCCQEGFRSRNNFCFTSGSNEWENENGIGSMASPSSNRPEFGFVKTEVRHEFTPETANIPLSKQVSEAIKQIELHISALQLDAKSNKNVFEPELCNRVADCFISSPINQTKGSDPSKYGPVVNGSRYQLDSESSLDPIAPSNSPYQCPIRMTNQSPNFAANRNTRTFEQSRYMSSQMARQQIRNEGLVSKHDVPSWAEDAVNEQEMQMLKGNWFKLEPAHEPNSSDHDIVNRRTRDYKGYSNLPGQKKTVNALSVFSAINQDQDPQNAGKTRIPKSTRQLKESKTDSRHSKTTTRQTSETRNLNRYTDYPKRRYIQQEPEATVSSSYSSQTSNQQESTDDYSVSGQISDQNYTEASISSIYSESEPYPSRPIRRSHYVTDSSSGENEAYSSSFPGSSGSTHSGESEVSSPSSYSHDSSSKACSPVRVYKSANSKKTKKKVGRWKRLKDKLGIIFHHHHHHHHHNNKKKDENSTDHRTKADRKPPSPKHKGKSPHPPRKQEVYEEQAVQKVGKSAVSDRHGKNQRQHGSHLHALVQGLIHARHLKKSSKLPPKHGSLPSKKGQHGNKKAVKASHWWQMLHHHGRFNKPPALLDK